MRRIGMLNLNFQNQRADRRRFQYERYIIHHVQRQTLWRMRIRAPSQVEWQIKWTNASVCVCAYARARSHRECLQFTQAPLSYTSHSIRVAVLYFGFLVLVPIYKTVGLLNVHNVTETPSTECPTYYMARSFLFNFADKFH